MGPGTVRAFGRAGVLLGVGLRAALVCGCVGLGYGSSLPDPYKD